MDEPEEAAREIERLRKVEAAARAVVSAFGGDTPDWIRAELAALVAALG